MGHSGRVNTNFWNGKRVLITGHTGFKGGWLSLWLTRMGAHVTGLSLPPNTSPALFTLARIPQFLTASYFADIRDPIQLLDLVRKAQPEILLHLAAQPLVRYSYSQPAETFSSNVMGTVNILDALRHTNSTRVALIVTTDKVYANSNRAVAFREEDALGGADPYSASKAASEFAVESYRKSFFSTSKLALGSARAGNVIGGGDWAEDRLLPDAVRAWQSGKPLDIRNPDAIRPWQHVLEPLAGYLILAQDLWEDKALEGAYNFGPVMHEEAPVRYVIELAQKSWGNGANVIWGCDTASNLHEASVLRLDNSKVRLTIGVEPRWSLAKAVERSVSWYKAVHAGEDAQALCYSDIDLFEAGV